VRKKKEKNGVGSAPVENVHMNRAVPFCQRNRQTRSKSGGPLGIARTLTASEDGEGLSRGPGRRRPETGTVDIRGNSGAGRGVGRGLKKKLTKHQQKKEKRRGLRPHLRCNLRNHGRTRRNQALIRAGLGDEKRNMAKKGIR